MRWFLKVACGNGFHKGPFMPPKRLCILCGRPCARCAEEICELRCGSRQVLRLVNFWDSSAFFACHRHAGKNCWDARAAPSSSKPRVSKNWHESLSPLE